LTDSNLAAESERVIGALGDYYIELKARVEHVSFILVTGALRHPGKGKLADFSNFYDITENSEYGELCGFTQAEIEGYFGARTKAAASALKRAPRELLDKLLNH
jgi:hypothetical protein